MDAHCNSSVVPPGHTNRSNASMMITNSGGSSASSTNSRTSRSMIHGAAARPAPLSYWSGYDSQMRAGFSWPPPSYTCNFCRREFRSAQALGGHMNVHRRDRARLRDSSPPSRVVADHHAQINPPGSQASQDAREEQRAVLVPNCGSPNKNPNPRKTRRPNPSDPEAEDPHDVCTPAIPNLNDLPEHLPVSFHAPPPIEDNSNTLQQRSCSGFPSLKLSPFTRDQLDRPFKALPFISNPGHADQKLQTDSTSQPLLSDEEMAYYHGFAEEGSNAQCSSNKRNKAPARRKGVVRLELEIGICGVDLDEDLDLELRLGYSTQLH